MTERMVRVPISRLLDAEMTPATKLIAIALRLNPAATPGEIQEQTGLSRPTVERWIDKVPRTNPGGPKAIIPSALLADRKVGTQAKVVYGLLQAIPSFRGRSGQFTYDSLSLPTGLSANTLRRAMADLAGAGWVSLRQSSRVSPITFSLGTPELRRSQFTAAVAKRRLKRSHHAGEAIMQEYLSLLIDSTQFTDNARPGFLINPLTGERMEFDRLYRENVAFEFNGGQHYGATELVTQASSDSQHLRDLIKAGICLYRGIQLVIIHAEDLSVRGMLKKIGQTMPLRSLVGQAPLIELLEEASLPYRAEAAAGARRTRS